MSGTIKIHRLYEVFPYFDEDAEEELYLVTGYGEFDVGWSEFEFVSGSVEFIYNLQRHFKSPTLEPYEVNL